MFPVIRNINDVLPHIKHKPEFLVIDKEDFIVINYHITNNDTFDNPYARECRGIKFCKKTGDIKARVLHKFFNINQVPETHEDIIAPRFNENHLVMQKLDGSLIHPILINGQIRLCTKMGITDVALQVEAFIQGKKNYYGLFQDWVESGCTPIFEWTSNQQRIVLDYPEDTLTLLAIRDTHTGSYSSYETLQMIGSDYDIPVVKNYPPFKDVYTLIKQTKSLEGEEGFVIRFNDGEMVKVKSDWYCIRHSSRDLISQEHKVIQLILKEEIDDIKPLLFGDDLKKLAELEELVERIIEFIAIRNNIWYEEVSKFESRKEFAVSDLAKDMSKSNKSAMFSMMDGKSARELAIKEVENNCKQSSLWTEFKKIYSVIGCLA